MVVGMIDLVVRGKKDVWMLESSNDSKLNIKILNEHFLSVFRKYSTLIKETRQLTLSGTNFGKEAKVVIPNFCDMYSEMYLQLYIESFLNIDASDEINIRNYTPNNDNDNYGYVDNLAFACIEKMELWAGKTKLDEYDHLELYTDFIERNDKTRRILLERKMGGVNIVSNNEYYKNQGGNLFFKLPFGLFQKYKPLPTWCVQASPLTLKIKFRQLSSLVSPSSRVNLQTLSTNSRTAIYTHNVTNEQITIQHRKPRLRFAYLHLEGIHLPMEARNQIQKYYETPRRIPITEYRQQEILLRENHGNPDNIEMCIGTTFRIPETGNIATFPIQLEFDVPVRHLHIFPQLELKRKTNLQYYDFLIDNEESEPLTNCQIITSMELQVNGIQIYPEIESSYYSVVTPYETNTNTLSEKTFLIPFDINGNINERIGELNTGYINYKKVNHSILNLNIQGWTADYDRAFKLYVIAKTWTILEMNNGRIQKVSV
jgi:hypothetical protein